MKTSPPRATIAIGAITVASYILVDALGIRDAATMSGGFIAARWSGMPIAGLVIPAWLTPLTTTLLHASLMHLGFNLLMLFFCGCHVTTGARDCQAV